ncbi:hypothetical protein J6590_093083 [Homalodisca vitripennis]|nr:hypothetical protein J6590_093083 [Homalodisca vitripennis]
MENYTAKDFESLRHSEQDRFLFDISDIMCNDSECGGDSDADDAFDKKRMPFQGHTSTPIKDSEALPSSSRIRGNNVPNYLSDSDSECVDDSDADPTYDPDEDIGNKSFFSTKEDYLSESENYESDDSKSKDKVDNLANDELLSSQNESQNEGSTEPVACDMWVKKLYLMRAREFGLTFAIRMTHLRPPPTCLRLAIF